MTLLCCLSSGPWRHLSGEEVLTNFCSVIQTFQTKVFDHSEEVVQEGMQEEVRSGRGEAPAASSCPGLCLLQVPPLLVCWCLPPSSPALCVRHSLPSFQIKLLLLLLYTFKYSKCLSSNLTSPLFWTCFSLSFCELLRGHS